jgi:DNA-binding CsgD family transcriptional regulator
LVDDVQWIDTESLRSLAFVARRLQAEGIAMLFGLRTVSEVPSDLAGIPSLEITGLPADAATELLSVVAGRSVPDDLGERIANETNGCPLALWELGKALALSRASRVDVLEEPPPISSRLRAHFGAQIATLSFDAQQFLLAAAADTSGDRVLIRTAAEVLGCTYQSEIEALEKQLILPGPRMKFRHPLIRSAVYSGASQKRRREVHSIFANLVSRSVYPDRWARHVVLGADGPDAEVASELEKTSHLAKARGGYAAQAALLIQSAGLSDQQQDRASRLLLAADAGLHAGDYQVVESVLDEAEPHLSQPLEVAEAARLRAQLCIQTYQTAAAPKMMLDAARLLIPVDVRRGRGALLEAFGALGIALQFTSGIEAGDVAQLANMTKQAGEVASLEDHILEGISQLVSSGPESGYSRFRTVARRIQECAVSEDEITRLSGVGTVMITVMNELLDDRGYRCWVEQTDRCARQNGALFALLFNMFAFVELDLRTGDLTAAKARHEEALDVAAAIGLPPEFYAPMSAEIHAWAGEEEQAGSYASLLVELNSAAGIGAPVLMGWRALAVLHLAAGRYKEANEALTCLHSESPLGYTSHYLPMAIEAATRSGEILLAESLLQRLEVRAKSSASDWAIGLLDQCRALLSTGIAADAMYRSALAHLGRTTVTRDLAYARLLYGEWLRRENRRIDAREQLRRAYEYFEAMGASGYAKRAEAELLATGERVRVRTYDRALDLTPQERRIAALAAQRLTNQEIASRLFLSPATVDYHLRKVYRKLSIGSRRQLAESLGATAAASGEAQAPGASYPGSSQPSESELRGSRGAKVEA